MAKYKKHIILFANNTSDEYIKPLIDLLNHNKISCKVVVTKTEIKFLLSESKNKIDHLLVTRNLQHTKPKAILAWANKNFEFNTIFFNELRLSDELEHYDYEKKSIPKNLNLPRRGLRQTFHNSNSPVLQKKSVKHVAPPVSAQISEPQTEPTSTPLPEVNPENKGDETPPKKVINTNPESSNPTESQLKNSMGTEENTSHEPPSKEDNSENHDLVQDKIAQDLESNTNEENTNPEAPLSNSEELQSEESTDKKESEALDAPNNDHLTDSEQNTDTDENNNEDQEGSLEEEHTSEGHADTNIEEPEKDNSDNDELDLTNDELTSEDLSSDLDDEQDEVNDTSTEHSDKSDDDIEPSSDEQVDNHETSADEDPQEPGELDTDNSVEENNIDHDLNTDDNNLDEASSEQLYENNESLERDTSEELDETDNDSSVEVNTMEHDLNTDDNDLDEASSEQLDENNESLERDTLEELDEIDNDSSAEINTMEHDLNPKGNLLDEASSDQLDESLERDTSGEVDEMVNANFTEEELSEKLEPQDEVSDIITDEQPATDLFADEQSSLHNDSPILDVETLEDNDKLEQPSAESDLSQLYNNEEQEESINEHLEQNLINDEGSGLFGENSLLPNYNDNDSNVDDNRAPEEVIISTPEVAQPPSSQQLEDNFRDDNSNKFSSKTNNDKAKEATSPPNQQKDFGDVIVQEPKHEKLDKQNLAEVQQKKPREQQDLSSPDVTKNKSTSQPRQSAPQPNNVQTPGLTHDKRTPGNPKPNFNSHDNEPTIDYATQEQEKSASLNNDSPERDSDTIINDESTKQEFEANTNLQEDSTEAMAEDLNKHEAKENKPDNSKVHIDDEEEMEEEPKSTLVHPNQTIPKDPLEALDEYIPPGHQQKRMSQPIEWIESPPSFNPYIPQPQDNGLLAQQLKNQLDLSSHKVEGSFSNSQVFMYKDEKFEGYIVVESPDPLLSQQLIQPIQNNILSGTEVHNSTMPFFMNKFIGSSQGNLPGNLYGQVQPHNSYMLPKNDGKIEIKPEQCSDKIRNQFNMYIKLQSELEDYLFVLKDKHLTSSKLQKIRDKNVNIRVNVSDLNPLITYLEIARIIQSETMG